jgi:hypothetical protein
MHAGTALAASALAFDVWGTRARVLNIDPLPVARDPGHHAAVLQNTHAGHCAEIDQLLCRAVRSGVEEVLQLGEACVGIT